MTAIVTTDPTAVIVVTQPARRQFTMMRMATAAHAEQFEPLRFPLARLH